MYRYITAGIGLAMLSSTALAQSAPVGVVVCDDFLTKYDACITTKMPAAQQTTFKGQLDQMRKSWAEMAKTPQGETQLESMCKQTVEQMKAMVQQQGCAF